MSDPTRRRPGQSHLERARFRAWLVTGPVGRLVGFALDFAKALKAHHKARKGAPR